MTSPGYVDPAQLWLLYQRAVPEMFRSASEKTQPVPARRGIYSMAIVTWLMIYQRLNSKRTLSAAVQWLARNFEAFLPYNDCKRLREGSVSTNTGGYCQGRQKLPKLVAVAAMDTLFDQLQQQMRKVMPDLPRPVFVADGSTLRTPAGAELARRFPPGSNQHGENHWPTMLVVVLHDAYTGLAARPAWGPKYGTDAVSEQQLARQALDRLPADAVVMADGNFGIFAFAYAVTQTNRPLLFRLTVSRGGKVLNGEPLRPGRRRKTVWQPSRWDRKQHPELPESCSIHGWVVACLNPCRPDEVLYFFTTLDLKPARILALYKLRWNIETDLRSLKRTVGLHELTGRTPDMVEKELLLAVSAYNLVRATIYRAARRAGLNPRDYSFSAAQDAVMAAWNDLSAAAGEGDRQRELDRLLDAVEQTRLPKRVRKRSYPRQVWGRGGQFPSRKPETHPESH